MQVEERGGRWRGSSGVEEVEVSREEMIFFRRKERRSVSRSVSRFVGVDSARWGRGLGRGLGLCGRGDCAGLWELGEWLGL